jgi:cobalt-zinc-cadmium efflux system membrane fusion protein
VPFGGYLKSTHLLPGMHIHKGEILATIEDQQYVQFQQDYLLAKSKVKYLQAEYIRQKELNQTKAVSDKAFQQAESDYNSQKIIIKSFYEKLKLMQLDPDKLDEGSITRSINIYSPIEGVVSKVNANIGKYIPATDVLFELINPSDIHLNFTVFEKDIDKLYVGQKVVAFNNHKANEKYICEILLISSDLKPDRTAEVHCHFEEYNKTLLPGMYMNAEIALQSENALSLPDEAILLFENEKYIFIEKDKNNYELTKVVVGASQDGFTIIESPKNIDNKKIVVKGAYTLLMKMKNVSEE